MAKTPKSQLVVGEMDPRSIKATIIIQKATTLTVMTQGREIKILTMAKTPKSLEKKMMVLRSIKAITKPHKATTSKPMTQGTEIRILTMAKTPKSQVAAEEMCPRSIKAIMTAHKATT